MYTCLCGLARFFLPQLVDRPVLLFPDLSSIRNVPTDSGKPPGKKPDCPPSRISSSQGVTRSSDAASAPWMIGSPSSLGCQSLPQMPTLQPFQAARPEGYALQQNHPNPFNASTTIAFAVAEAGDVALSIYNLSGQVIRTLHSGQ